MKKTKCMKTLGVSSVAFLMMCTCTIASMNTNNYYVEGMCESIDTQDKFTIEWQRAPNKTGDYYNNQNTVQMILKANGKVFKEFEALLQRKKSPFRDKKEWSYTIEHLGGGMGEETLGFGLQRFKIDPNLADFHYSQKTFRSGSSTNINYYRRGVTFNDDLILDARGKLTEFEKLTEIIITIKSDPPEEYFTYRDRRIDHGTTPSPDQVGFSTRIMMDCKTRIVPKQGEAPPQERITSIYQMFKNPEDALETYPAAGRVIAKICTRMIGSSGLYKKYVGGGASYKPSSKTPYMMVDYYIKRYNAPPIETFLGDFVCEREYPVMYYAVKEGLCGDAYGFLRKLQELRDDGRISQKVLREIITEGPLHPNRYSSQPPYNIMDLFEGDIPGQPYGHDDWCPFVKKEFEKELAR